VTLQDDEPTDPEYSFTVYLPMIAN
jgi:hypothetical protein